MARRSSLQQHRENVVRISYKELLTLAEYLKSQKDTEDKGGTMPTAPDKDHHSKTSRRDTKKRELQIYRPGMGLQQKATPSPIMRKDSSVVTGELPKLSTQDSFRTSDIADQTPHGCSNHPLDREQQTPSPSEQENVQAKTKNRLRRPDIKVYVPKAKAAALKENGHVESDEKERDLVVHESVISESSVGSNPSSPHPSKRYSKMVNRLRKSSESGTSDGTSVSTESAEKTTKGVESSMRQNKSEKSGTSRNHIIVAASEPKAKQLNENKSSKGSDVISASPKRNRHKDVCEVPPISFNAGNKGDGAHTEKVRSSGRHRRRRGNRERNILKTSSQMHHRLQNFSLVVDEAEDWDADLVVPEMGKKALSQEELNSELHDKKLQNSKQNISDHDDEEQSSRQVVCRESNEPFTNTSHHMTSQQSRNRSKSFSEQFSPVIKDWSMEVEDGASPSNRSCFDFSGEHKDSKHTRNRNEPDTSALHRYGSASKQQRKNDEVSKVDSGGLKQDRVSAGDVKSSSKKKESKAEKKTAKEKSEFEKNLPPRLQKLNKGIKVPDDCGLSLDSDKPENKVGGIIRLPSQSAIKDCIIPPNEPPMIPTTYPASHIYAGNADGMVGVSKQLFDPTNPEKPLVVVKPQLHIPSTMGSPVYRHPIPGTIPLSSPVQDAFRLMGQSYSNVHIQPPPYSMPAGLPSHPISPGAYPFGDQPQFDSRGRRLKPLVEKNLNKAALLERELASYVMKGLQNVDTKAVEQCRWKLQLRYENVILADPRYCAERNVEQQLWKSAFYQFIELLRRQMEDPTQDQEEHRQALIKLVDEATVFFENLLEKLQETLGFSIDKFANPECECPPAPDAVRLALISAQKMFIYLGDLARYREQANGNTNFGKARSWYLKAQQIAPKNGRPYNQLALLAVYGRRKLDAVYYYMRSLAASNPFLSARENLLSLFDEARKKYEHVEKKRQEDLKARREEIERLKKAELFEDRFEVWIRPDGSSSKQSTHKTEEEEEEDQLNQMPTVDLNKRFVLSFLHVHGKLFTKVGMETFTETVNQMLKEFRALLNRTPAPVGSTRLLQLLAINMFAVANTSLKDQSLDPQCRSLLQEQALQVILAMISIILERATVLLREHIASSDYPKNIVSADLSELMPAIKVWTDWMSCQKHLWVPPPPSTDFKTGCKGDVWELFAGLLTVVRDIDMSGVELLPERREGYETVTLPEDNTLAGFVPLLGAPQDIHYAQPPIDKERARHYLRISRIQFFGDYLCGIHTPYLEFNVEKRRFVSVVTARSEENTESTQDPMMESSDDDTNLVDPLQDDDEDDDDFSTDGEDDEEEEDDSGDGCERNEIQRLWSRKEALRKAKAKQDKHRAQIHAVLQEHQHKRPTVLLVQPRYLIPDTNCFIDHLDQLRSLVASQQFNLVVPLIVINELDGLARGSRESPYHSTEHARKVASAAKEAVLFLEERFAARDHHLRAITSKGSVLDTISFRSEDVRDNKGTNDDLILSCCLHYSQDRAEQFMPKDLDSPLKLSREAVLLTEDRNLRVKAISHNVPVRDLAAFLRWANIR